MQAPPLRWSSEAACLRNQEVFQRERAAASRLQECYRRCFELASAAFQRGDHAAANELRLKGHAYREQYEEERAKAARRISKRM